MESAKQNRNNINNTKYIEKMGDILGMVGGALSGALSGVGRKGREQRQQGYTKDLMGLQQKNQQALNQQGHQLQMDMWNKTNYGAQMEHLKGAGLNPALMYGMSGGGGTTAGSQSGGSAAGGQGAKVNESQIGQGTSMGMLTKAQIENINEQTRKTGIEADKLAGIDTKKTEQDVKESEGRVRNLTATEKKLLQETSNLKTKQDLDKLQIELGKQVWDRQDKGMIKGDTIGNMLEAVGLDPKNNEKDRTIVRGMLGAWFGSKIAGDVIGAIMKVKGLGIKK